MRHLKLYEAGPELKKQIETPDFEPIDIRKWNEFIKNIVSFNPTKASAIPSGLKKEIKKTVQMGQSKRIKVTDAPNIPSNNILNYLVIYVDKNIIFVYELEDEYYGVYADIGKHYFRFKCDQIEGVTKCIKHILSTRPPDPTPLGKRRL